MITHYLKIAWRNLWKYKVQSVISMAGLAVCVLCFSICLYICRLMWATDRCFPKKERIAEVVLNGPHGDFSGIPLDLLDKLRGMHSPAIEAFTYVAYPGNRSYEIEVKPDEMLPFAPLYCMEIDTCFRQVFGLEILAGSWETATRTPNAIILSESTARRIYGEHYAEAVGKRMMTTAKLPFSKRKGGVAYTVQAVMADIPINNSLSYMSPLDLLVMNDSDGRMQAGAADGITGAFGYVLLRDGDEREALEADIHRRGLTHFMFSGEYQIRLHPLGYYFWKYSTMTPIMWTVFAIGTLVLIVGLLNFFYFQAGLFLGRNREYSLRRVFGGSEAGLFRLLFTQALLTALLAFLPVFVLTEVWVPELQVAIGGLAVPIEASRLRWECAQYLLGVVACSGLVCLSIVAHLRHNTVQAGIRGIFVGRGKHRVRNSALAVQYFICWIFVTFAAALYLQTEKTTSALFGSLTSREKSDILSIPLDYPFMEQADKLALVERIRKHAGVKDCLLADIGYTRGVSGNMLYDRPSSEPDARWFEANIIGVPENFFSFMHISVVQGRLPNGGDGLVVDETFTREAQEKNGESPLGRVFYGYDKGHRVEAVCPPFVTSAYSGGGSKGYVFMPSDFRQYVGHCYLKCHAGQTEEVRDHVGRLLRQALPATIHPHISTLSEDIKKEQWLENGLKDIIFILAVTCVVITLLGVYAAITLDTERRSKEVAIRKINGAGVRQIIWLFARTYLWIGGLTAVAAFPLLYWLMGQWKQKYDIFFLYGPGFWLGIFLAVMAVTALTIVYRIVRIARLNPAEVTKEMN